MEINAVLGATENYELKVIAKSLTYGVVNRTTGVVELEGIQLPLMMRSMKELENLLTSWTPAIEAHEHNETDSTLAALSMEEIE